MWTSIHENQVTLRQCLKCAEKPECQILDRVLAYAPHISAQKPPEWAERQTMSICTRFVKKETK